MHSMVASCVAKCSRAISASYRACMLIQNMSLSPSAREPQCSVGANAALAVHDLVDAPRRHVDRFGDPILRDAQRVEEFGLEDLTRVSGCEVRHGLCSF
jgi:hypothetical protein